MSNSITRRLRKHLHATAIYIVYVRTTYPNMRQIDFDKVHLVAAYRIMLGHFRKMANHTKGEHKNTKKIASDFDWALRGGPAVNYMVGKLVNLIGSSANKQLRHLFRVDCAPGCRWHREGKTNTHSTITAITCNRRGKYRDQYQSCGGHIQTQSECLCVYAQLPLCRRTERWYAEERSENASLTSISVCYAVCAYACVLVYMSSNFMFGVV